MSFRSSRGAVVIQTALLIALLGTIATLSQLQQTVAQKRAAEVQLAATAATQTTASTQCTQVKEAGPTEIVGKCVDGESYSVTVIDGKAKVNIDDTPVDHCRPNQNRSCPLTYCIGVDPKSSPCVTVRIGAGENGGDAIDRAGEVAYAKQARDKAVSGFMEERKLGVDYANAYNDVKQTNQELTDAINAAHSSGDFTSGQQQALLAETKSIEQALAGLAGGEDNEIDEAYDTLENSLNSNSLSTITSNPDNFVDVLRPEQYAREDIDDQSDQDLWNATRKSESTFDPTDDENNPESNKSQTQAELNALDKVNAANKAIKDAEAQLKTCSEGWWGTYCRWSANTQLESAQRTLEQARAEYAQAAGDEEKTSRDPTLTSRTLATAQERAMAEWELAGAQKASEDFEKNPYGYCMGLGNSHSTCTNQKALDQIQTDLNNKTNQAEGRIDGLNERYGDPNTLSQEKELADLEKQRKALADEPCGTWCRVKEWAGVGETQAQREARINDLDRRIVEIKTSASQEPIVVVDPTTGRPVPLYNPNLSGRDLNATVNNAGSGDRMGLVDQEQATGDIERPAPTTPRTPPTTPPTVPPPTRQPGSNNPFGGGSNGLLNNGFMQGLMQGLGQQQAQQAAQQRAQQMAQQACAQYPGTTLVSGQCKCQGSAVWNGSQCTQCPAGTSLVNGRCDCQAPYVWNGSSCTTTGGGTTNGVKATLSCAPAQQENNGPITIAWSCGISQAASNATGFSTNNKASGSIVVTAEENDEKRMDFALTCSYQGQTSSASCAVGVSKALLVVTTIPGDTDVPQGTEATIGWTGTGITDATDACKITSDDYAGWEKTGGKTGVVKTPQLISDVTFTVSCEKISGGTIEKDIDFSIATSN